ncbi:hypothetical protein MHH56_29940 [Paenibacillus sp. FSL K6-3182]|uniref:hypothetical protein n=1 Tax=Paenibacillus sp. FSL K6-3182 TaxID=2921495 RepID=UPI0030D4C95A
MKKTFLYAPIILVALFFLSMNEAGDELHWKKIVEKILVLGSAFGVLYLINWLTKNKLYVY